MPSFKSSRSQDDPWRAVTALALSVFIFVTTEFIPVALLSAIGKSFAISVEATGRMLTIYAWAVALASLPLTLLTSSIERRRLLTAVFLVFIASHALSALAWNFAVLTLARLGVALSHAVFWSITGPLAVRIVPPDRAAKALGALAVGSTLAMVLGIPLGRMLGEALGWRMSFLAIGALACLTLCGLMRELPELPSENAGSIGSLSVIFARPALLSLYALTALVVTGQFIAYSYIEPFAREAAHLTPRQITVFLLCMGGAGIIGSFLFTRYAERFPKGFPIASIALLAVCLLTLLPLAGLTSPALFFGLALLWGAAMMCLGLILQMRVLLLTRDVPDVAMSIYSALFNVGIGAGALLGGLVASHLGLRYIGISGGLLALAGLGWRGFAMKRFPDAQASNHCQRTPTGKK
jgi:multidrug resistance protein